jgi:adenine-specific DNA-methyltransferase
METTGVKYIGSKGSLIPHILKAIDESSTTPISSVLDVFTGTTRVAQAFKTRGWKVTSSDLSWASDAYAHTWIANEAKNDHLQLRINHLNSLSGSPGWLTNNYCDVKGADDSIVRVWQAKNGSKADKIRDTIEQWQSCGDIQPWEAKTLITSLILALDKVDNTVGVQQAYLKAWCQRSHNDLLMTLPRSIEGPKGEHLVGDCLKLNYPQADVAYIDPPYSAHSYSTYYHIWDSIARWDKPSVGLKTNRRIDRVSGADEFDSSMCSSWNSKKTALKSFGDLIDRLPVRTVIVSYNNEAVVPIEKLIDLFKKYQSVKITKIDYDRNIMCQIGNAAKDETAEKTFTTKNIEYLFTIQK